MHWDIDHFTGNDHSISTFGRFPLIVLQFSCRSPFFVNIHSFCIQEMLSTPSFLGLLALPALIIAAPAPAPTTAAKLEDRAETCTFTNAASASASKKSCATIVLSSIPVPSGVTLDLTGLTKGTHVIFEGETTFGYEEWSGPLVSVSGTDITVTAASGAYFAGDGARWWDGKSFLINFDESFLADFLPKARDPMVAVSIFLEFEPRRRREVGSYAGFHLITT